MKKKYIPPKMDIIPCPMESPILSDSSDPWWEPPETEEGCESAWWCGK